LGRTSASTDPLSTWTFKRRPLVNDGKVALMIGLPVGALQLDHVFDEFHWIDPPGRR
jgi:hypothetical protein